MTSGQGTNFLPTCTVSIIAWECQTYSREACVRPSTRRPTGLNQSRLLWVRSHSDMIWVAPRLLSSTRRSHPRKRWLSHSCSSSLATSLRTRPRIRESAPGTLHPSTCMATRAVVMMKACLFDFELNERNASILQINNHSSSIAIRGFGVLG